MAYLVETASYDTGVYQLETTDPVAGGPSGVANSPLKNLANRTAYLKAHVDALENSRAPKDSPTFTGTPSGPTAAAGTNTTQFATTAFVQAGLSQKQNSLGFAPVEQGGGADQLGNKVRIGWSAAGRLKAQVDATDLGNFVFDSQLSNYLPKSGGDMSGPITFGNQSIGGTTGDGASWTVQNIRITSWFGIGFHSSFDNTTRIVFDTRTGDMSTRGRVMADGEVWSGTNLWAKGSDLYLTPGKKSTVASDGASTYLRLGDAGGSFFFQNPAGGELAKMAPNGSMRFQGRVFGPSFFFSETGDDTGFDHPADGSITQYNNGTATWAHTQASSSAAVPVNVPTPVASDSSTRVATTAHVKDYLANIALEGSIGLPGRQKLAPNGHQIRYGVAPSSVVGGGGANPVDAVFSTAFPNACLAVFVTLTGNASSRAVEWQPASTTSASARILYTSQNSTTVTMQAVYLAIGY